MSADPLESRVKAMSSVENPTTASQVLDLAHARARRRRAVGVMGGGLALAAAGLLVLSLAPQDTQRARGMTTPAPVAIEAVVEGPRGARALVPGQAVGPDEAVVIRLRTGGPGLLTVTEDGAELWPAVGTEWQVGAGEHYVGGDVPLAWRPDSGSGSHVLRARLCAPDGPPTRCTDAELSVLFE